MKIYLLTTDHLNSAIWFRDEEDFKAAMNAIPVLEGSYDQVLKFITSFKDHIILPFVKEMCSTLFNKGAVKDLNTLERAELLRQLRYRFSANINQLMRVTGLPYEEVVRLLESL